MTGALLASALLLHFHSNPGLLGEGLLGSGCFQTAKGYSIGCSVRGKGRAIGWILKLMLGLTPSVPHGENQAPCAPNVGYAASHTECVSIGAKNVPDRLRFTRALLQSKGCG